MNRFACLAASRTLVHSIAVKLVPYRFWINLAFHVLLFNLSFRVSYSILTVSQEDEKAAGFSYAALAALVFIRTAVFWYHDLFQGLWRYVSFEDLLNIIRATIIGTFGFALFGAVWSFVRMPQEFYFLEFSYCILLTGGMRLIVRNFREKYHIRPPADRKQENIIIVGPVDSVQPIVKELVSDSNRRYHPVTIIDPEKKAASPVTRLNDIPILSLRAALKSARRFRGIHAFVLHWPQASRRRLDQIVEELKSFKIPYKQLPRMEDILSEKVTINDIREVEIEDLLERPSVHIEMRKIRRYIEGKTIMVTGGGGSIGSELCRQIAGFKPGKLVVVERSENSLYDLQIEFRSKHPQIELMASISSINDGIGLETICRQNRVDVIFHAAAYKHVPLMEEAPIESAYNNIIGTFNTAKAAVNSGVKRFVMISTDKAVNPTNVMGVTKRIAEMVVQSLDKSGGTRFMIVRFGNVLDSAGSVIPVFKKQIKRGGPLTVTHPDIERFFMTIPEAVQLVLQAGCMGSGGEIFVLDMGKSVKILELAEKLITLSGKRPYDDIEIHFTGLRPGEKMYEELFNDGEKTRKTSHSQIFTAETMPQNNRQVLSRIEIIRTILANRDEASLIRLFKTMVPNYHPNCQMMIRLADPSGDAGKPSGEPAAITVPNAL